MSSKTCLMTAAVLGFLAVFFGAFAAHGLKDSGYLERQFATTESKSLAGLKVPAAYKYLVDFETGVRYHMWHALALAVTGLMMQRARSTSLTIAAGCFVAGIVAFSGSLYVIALGGPRFGGITWGLIAPLGGTLLLIGWMALLVGAWRSTTA